jgi:putative transposase of IS4/5 family DUF4096
VPEVRRLLQLMTQPAGAERAHHLHWSVWRRQHQAVARRGHCARRAQRPPPAQPGPRTPEPIPVHVVPGTATLSARAWAKIAALVLPVVPQRGRPSGDLRSQLEGMLAVMHSGGPWREVPAACGPWQTIYARYALWVRTGLWEQIATILHPDPSPREVATSP